MAKVLVIDDEPGIRRAFERLLKELGHEPFAAGSAEEGLEILRRERPEAVFLDVRLPGMDGLAALERIRGEGSPAQVVVMTAHGTLDVAVRAVRLGAFEYVAKPPDLAQVELVLERALDRGRLSQEVSRLRRELAERAEPGTFIGRSAAMQEVFKQIAAVAPGDVPVLLVGESGTGKELVARAIHAQGPRVAGPFEPVHCASLPETLVESELFGHERGAFTGAVQARAGRLERAHGGTLFLDEIGEIPPAVQTKLLRFLEDRRVERLGGSGSAPCDVRIVTATNRELAADVRQGRFREDLFYRIRGVTIRMPPLRERMGDLPLLVTHFLGDAEIDQEAMALLQAHAWPGNVRELRQAIEHGRAMARGRPIRPEHLPESVRAPGVSGPAADGLDARLARWVGDFLASGEGTAGPVFEALERRWQKALLRAVLDAGGGNQVQASERLGISRTTLRKKVEELGL